MMDFVKSVHDFEAAATQAAESRQRDIEAMFKAIDTDMTGSIDENEFITVLGKSTGMPRDELSRLFRQKDVDCSGALDKHEFVELVKVRCFYPIARPTHPPPLRTSSRPRPIQRPLSPLPPTPHPLSLRGQACDLLNHQEKILAEGAATRETKERETREKQDLWRIGLPNKGRRNSVDRPSLLAVSADLINQRKERPSLLGGFSVLKWENEDGKKVRMGF